MMGLPAIPKALASKITHSLAMELASQLRPAKDVLKDHRISAADWDQIKDHPHFRQLMKEAETYWNSSDNALERIKAVSGAMTEEALLPVFQLAHNEDIHPSTRLEAVKLLAKLSGADAQAKPNGFGVSAGERFQININLGDSSDEKKTVTIDTVAQDPPVDEAEDVLGPVLSELSKGGDQ